MKILSTAILSLLFAGSVFAGCPSKTIKGKVVGFDEESKTLTVALGKKEKKFQVGSKTKMEGFFCYERNGLWIFSKTAWIDLHHYGCIAIGIKIP